jgi:hypothetical protein
MRLMFITFCGKVDLVRYDFHKRNQTSHYWCYKLSKANRQ